LIVAIGSVWVRGVEGSIAFGGCANVARRAPEAVGYAGKHPGKGHRSAKRGGKKQLAVFVPLTAQLGWGAKWMWG
jgi:hypothetical protein